MRPARAVGGSIAVEYFKQRCDHVFRTQQPQAVDGGGARLAIRIARVLHQRVETLAGFHAAVPQDCQMGQQEVQASWLYARGINQLIHGFRGLAVAGLHAPDFKSSGANAKIV